VYGGAGTLAENGVERWLREAMILAIWEGTPHRQMLDALEVMQAKGAHRLLFRHLAEAADAARLAEMEARVAAVLTLPVDEREAGAEGVFRDLAAFAAEAFDRSRR
jgi:hypothetical protein